MPRLTQDTARLPDSFVYEALTRCGRASHPVRLPSSVPCRGPTTPSLRTVWPVPRSLAATGGITVVFSSSGY